MIRHIFASFLACLFLIAATGASAEIINLSPSEALTLLRTAPDDLTLLDVRTPKEYATGHIPGAINADCLKKDFQDELERLPKDKPLLMYCRSGQRTKGAGKIAEDAGFAKIYVIEKGVEDWRKAGLPLEK